MPANAPPDGEDLLSLKEGGLTAFESLYKSYWYKLYCVAVKQTGSKQDAEELVQALFEKIWTNRMTLSVRHWGPYLMVSLRNMIVDLQRRQSVQKAFLRQYSEPEGAATPEGAYDQQQLQSAIDSALETLPEKTQTIFKLSRYEHKSIKEIAGSLHLTEKAVEYHITKSLRLLRQHLRNYLNIFFNFF